eukprot:scaffold143519_cov18-Tisochrysis_lutea.AAC.2
MFGKRKASAKRFSLLLLEEEEDYVQDWVVRCRCVRWEWCGCGEQYDPHCLVSAAEACPQAKHLGKVTCSGHKHYFLNGTMDGIVKCMERPWKFSACCPCSLAGHYFGLSAVHKAIP